MTEEKYYCQSNLGCKNEVQKGYSRCKSCFEKARHYFLNSDRYSDEQKKILFTKTYEETKEDLDSAQDSEAVEEQEVFDTIQEEKKRLDELKFDVCNLVRLKEQGKATEMLVSEIKKNFYICTFRSDIEQAQEMWIYDNGKYINNGEIRLREFIRKVLGDTYSSHFVKNIIDKIKVDTCIDSQVFIDECLNHHLEINVNNGIIKIDPKTYEIKLLPHTPNKKFLYKLDWDYNPEAKCPLIDKFLSDVMSDPTDKLALDESLGVSLYPQLITKKAIMLNGKPHTSKSTTLNLLEYFLGQNNCSNLSLKQITSKDFLLHNLFGKLANLSNDLSSEEISDIALFKELTGGDILSTDRKFREQISFKNLAKFFFGCNQFPRVFNADDAFWERWLPFKFNKVFIEKDEYDSLPEDKKSEYGIRDNFILDKLKTPEEMSGLLNNALEGLIRYLKNGTFSQSRSLKEIMSDFIRQSSSFNAFFMDNLEIGDPNKDFVFKKILAKRYAQYCSTHNVKMESNKSVCIVLEQKGVYTGGDAKKDFSKMQNDPTYGSSSTWTVQERVWEGIKWKEEPKQA